MNKEFEKALMELLEHECECTLKQQLEEKVYKRKEKIKKILKANGRNSNNLRN